MANEEFLLAVKSVLDLVQANCQQNYERIAVLKAAIQALRTQPAIKVDAVP